MITMQALMNNQPSQEARQLKSSIDYQKPIAMEIANREVDNKSSCFLRVTLKYRHQEQMTGNVLITSHLNKYGLFIISLGMQEKKLSKEILALDDASIHSLVSIIIDHLIDFSLFNAKQPLGIELGHSIYKDNKYRIVQSQWYGGSLADIQKLGNKEQKKLYYDGMNIITIDSHIQAINK